MRNISNNIKSQKFILNNELNKNINESKSVKLVNYNIFN